jgi:hypothetical protein
MSAGHMREDEKLATLTLRADLAVGLASARQARAAIRQALAAWGMDDPSGDAELLASELVANAAERTGSHQIGFVLRRHTGRDGQRGLTCEVTDTSPILPRPRQASASKRARPGPGHRHRPCRHQRRPARGERQDDLVHPRPAPPPGHHLPGRPATARARTQSRGLTTSDEGAQP